MVGIGFVCCALHEIASTFGIPFQATKNPLNYSGRDARAMRHEIRRRLSSYDTLATCAIHETPVNLSLEHLMRTLVDRINIGATYRSSVRQSKSNQQDAVSLSGRAKRSHA